MAKRSFRGKPKKKKSAQSSNMMAQVQKMQQDMAEAQAALENETVTVTAGGGAISITITGHQRVRDIVINPELLDPEEAELLQDMLIAGINSAIEQSQTMSAERMESVTGNMGGLSDMLGGLGLG
ncbi:MAG: YbaB/EbfC family nucleoid-associated protein [Candidatus Promineifilaceae bacterium]|nr:YbaB/EbfC family nucleoid-associated protein [Candidatus Promineifilaceae bacterium]